MLPDEPTSGTISVFIECLPSLGAPSPRNENLTSNRNSGRRAEIIIPCPGHARLCPTKS